MSVHILGAGAMGSLAAHELALGGRIAPTLLLKSRNTADFYHEQHNGSVTLLRPSGADTTTQTVKVPALSEPKREKDWKIDNLIISTKTYTTEQALAPYVPHIHSDTNILLLQNGMGMVPTLIESFWKGTERPNIFQAISTHGAYKVSQGVVNHVGLGSLTISCYPRVMREAPSASEMDIKTAPELIQALLDRSDLDVTYVTYPYFLLRQMEKLVVNACINPLTAMLDCFNGDLLYGNKVTNVMRRVVDESVKCFKAEFGSQLTLPETAAVLDQERLMANVLDVCRSTAQNSSLMREDVRKLNMTEIDWINGYIMQLGHKWDIPTPTNRLLLSMVKDKVAIERAKENAALKESLV